MKRHRVQIILFFWLVAGVCLVPSLGKTIQQGDRLVIGTTTEIFSKVLGEDRPLWIYLPAEYEESKETYPVFYLLDGELQFFNVSGIVDFLSGYAHMPRMILVAVPNVDRERDFLPTSVNDWPPVAAADKFHEFLKKELIPHVEKNYRTRPYRILCGHSYGGTFCIDSFLRDPDLFTAYIAISSELVWDNRLLVKKGEQVFKNTVFDKKFLFLAISEDDEGSIPANKEFVALLEKYAPRGLEWHFEYLEGEDHLTVVHPVVYKALKWLHQGWRIPERTLEVMTLEQVKTHYRELTRRYGHPVPVPEGVLFNLGYSLLDNGKKKEAMEAFKYNIELYAGFPSGYVGLGEVYEEAGELELALENYELGLEMAKKTRDTMVIPIAEDLVERVKKKLANQKK